MVPAAAFDDFLLPLLTALALDAVFGDMRAVFRAIPHPVALAGGLKAAIFICYEIIFPAEVEEGVRGADFIVNVTNDAWFGDTPGPYQHFRNAQIRAVETGLPVVRAANNGISGVIDTHGRVVDAFALNVKGALDATVAIPPAGPRPFGDPEGNGYAIIGFMALAGIGMSLVQRLRRI